MKAEYVNEFIHKIDRNMALIESVIRGVLGVDTSFVVSVKSPSHTPEKYVSLEEVGTETKKQMTATPLLAQLFKDARLRVTCWYDKENNKGIFNVEVQYDHNYRGGSNGHDLYKFNIDFATGKAQEN